MRSASGRTTVPMSRPAMMIRPPSTSRRCRWSSAARSSATLGVRRDRRRPRPARGPRPSGRRHRRQRARAGPSRRRAAGSRRRAATSAAVSSGRDAPVDREPRHRAVQETRVAEAIAQPCGRGRADAALPRGRRPVEGDDEAAPLVGRPRCLHGGLLDCHRGEDTGAPPPTEPPSASGALLRICSIRVLSPSREPGRRASRRVTARDQPARPHEALRRGQGGRRRLADDRHRRVLLAPRAVGLRQDHDPPDDRRVRPADERRGRAPRPGRDPRPAGQAAREHGLPELRPVPPPRRRGQHRVRAEAARGRRATRSSAAPAPSSSGSTSPATSAGGRTSCPAGSSSASRSRGRS